MMSEEVEMQLSDHWKSRLTRKELMSKPYLCLFFSTIFLLSSFIELLLMKFLMKYYVDDILDHLVLVEHIVIVVADTKTYYFWFLDLLLLPHSLFVLSELGLTWVFWNYAVKKWRRKPKPLLKPRTPMIICSLAIACECAVVGILLHCVLKSGCTTFWVAIYLINILYNAITILVFNRDLAKQPEPSPAPSNSNSVQDMQLVQLNQLIENLSMLTGESIEQTIRTIQTLIENENPAVDNDINVPDLNEEHDNYQPIHYDPVVRNEVIPDNRLTNNISDNFNNFFNNEEDPSFDINFLASSTPSPGASSSETVVLFPL